MNITLSQIKEAQANMAQLICDFEAQVEAEIVPVGSLRLKPGERYAGIIMEAGLPCYHLILLEAKSLRLTWVGATAWAKSIGGQLPTIREMSLLHSNLGEEIAKEGHWSCDEVEQMPGLAMFRWWKDFQTGVQGTIPKGRTLKARAIRRVSLIK